MDVYTTDDERVEAIKKWWQDNGRSLVVGVVIGLSVLFGWRYWIAYQQTQAELASALYNQVSNAVAKEDETTAQSSVDLLLSQHSQSPYATLAAMALAKFKVSKGELEAAQTQLQWASDNATQKQLKQLATLRLARVQLAQQKYDEALTSLKESDENGFTAQYEELKGDIYKLKGDIKQAAVAYQKAIKTFPFEFQAPPQLRMKLDDVGGAMPQEATS